MRGAALTLLAGCLLSAGAPAAWWAQERRDREFGGVVAQQLATPPSPTPTAAPVAAPARPEVPTRPARLRDVVDPPVEVRLAGTTAPVDPVGLDGDRQVVVPEDVRRAGWYASGPQPGDPAGSAVLVGHADDATQGLGTFARLRELRAGAEVVVRTASGDELTYEVTSRERFRKTEVPLTRIFSRTGPARLVLVSCSGDFDPVTRTYSDNVVVTAVPR